MMEVLRAGACDLVMDMGRPGWRSQGVPAGGAADPEALAAANRLVGNAPGAAGLECCIAGPLLRFPGGAVVALTGARFGARRGGRGGAVGWAQTLVLGAGETLDLGRAEDGLRCWLAVGGGFDITPVLGSASTFLPGRFGGLAGRPLRAGDTLDMLEPAGGARMRRAHPPDTRADRAGACLRVVPGPQRGRFDDAGLTAFFTATYRVGDAADRRGIRLVGPGVSGSGPECASQGVLPGAIQVPPDGQAIILGWDGPVTGGYPVIATVVSADWAALAQLRPGDPVCFSTLDVDAARQLPRAWLIEDFV